MNPEQANFLKQRSANFLMKGQKVNTLGFVSIWSLSKLLNSTGIEHCYRQYRNDNGCFVQDKNRHETRSVCLLLCPKIVVVFKKKGD
jgi:hypothetical protein